MHLLSNSNEPQNSLKNKLKITINLALITYISFLTKFQTGISQIRLIAQSLPGAHTKCL